MSSVPSRDEPCYIISVASKLVEMHPQTLRYYEALGLVAPHRSAGNKRLYSLSDVERLRKIGRLVGELGVNLAGVEVILNMSERLEQLQAELEQMEAEMRAEIERLHRELAGD